MNYVIQIGMRYRSSLIIDKYYPPSHHQYHYCPVGFSSPAPSPRQPHRIIQYKCKWAATDDDELKLNGLNLTN